MTAAGNPAAVALGLCLAILLPGCAPQPVAPATLPDTAMPVPVATGVSLPEYRRIVLDNGAVILLLEKHDVPLIGFQAALRGGSVADPAGRDGTASIFATLLEKGAGDRDARAFAEAVASVGGELGASAGLEAVNISGEFLARDTALMIELLADMLMRPALAGDEFARQRDRAIELVKAARDADPRALLGTYGEAFLFPDHPYGRAASETTLAALTLDDVRRFHAEQVGADRLVLAMAGDFDADDMERRLRTALSAMPRARGAVPVVRAPPRAVGTRVLLVDKPGATQSYFWIGNRSVARDYARRAELNLANTVFGGRFTSMLNTELRIKSGLSYGASSRLVQPGQPGSLAIVSFTRTDATVEAMDLALATLERLHREGLDEETLASAKAYVLGQYPLGFETARQLAGQLTSLEFYGLGRDYVDTYGAAVEAATAADVAQVISEVYPPASDLVFVVIADGAVVREALSGYGPVREVSILEPNFAVGPTG